VPRNLFPLVRLEGDQGLASSPGDHAALSASAGTGKTHVLTARVLRLLLAGAGPSTILCLTFTKAGAAEMADRIHSRLAYWVRLEDSKLRKEIFALEDRCDDELLERARTLFAQVLDAPGGGLRVLTIHAFAQSLLGAFPAEAGLTPGFRPLEGREEQLLARATLSDLLVRAERGGDAALIRDLQALSHRLGESGAESFLKSCARAPDAMEALGPHLGIEARLRRAFDLPAGDIEAAIVAECADDAFSVAALREIAALNSRWGTRTGLERAALCERWLAAGPVDRATLLKELHSVWAKKNGEILAFGPGRAPTDDTYPELAQTAFECCGRLLSMRRVAALVATLAAGLRAGQAFASAYAAAKRAAGVADFDDLIRWAERLLMTDGMGDWVRYKLDQSIDHILVDEAQDTNARQWNIVRALTQEYFAGEGASHRHRSIFTVGDYKQAIFGFQGTDPKLFDIARTWFAREAAAIDRAFLDLSMDLSFRSAPPILGFVNRVLGELGPDSLGLDRPANPHEAHHRARPGSVVLWDPMVNELGEEADDAGEEGWIGDSVRRYARRLALQIRDWMENPFELAGKRRKRRPVRPEDILILVRRRGDLASLIVARLHAEGVPVAGVDRLLLTAPLAVQDLLAAARFAVQPLDDLNLAVLLVSPLFGWSQDQLFAVAHGRQGALWPTLRKHEDMPHVAEALDGLGSLLGMADYATPHQFLETILSGPLEGRRRLLERLGPEARDPIEELLSSAIEFETGSVPSLQRFLDWFARGDVEIVRDPSTPLDAVRVMTVHGAKGLQSPVVILADACGDPDRRPGGGVVRLALEEGGEPVPLFRPRRDEAGEPLASELARQEKLERQEHWRLFYVAMTRAEERLYIGGALGPADRNGPAQASWYRAAERALTGLAAQPEPATHWGKALRFGDVEKPISRPVVTDRDQLVSLPVWLCEQAPVEARPPRPLVPSGPWTDEVADPPPHPALRAAAERGRLLHQLFERLPDVAESQRSGLAEAWLERSAGVSDPDFRSALVADACAILSDPSFAEVFSAGALAEAPIAAVIGGGHVISGTVDRLFVADDHIRLVDFKTGRSAPREPGDIPAPHLRQMASYVAALEVIFPGRRIDAALLYTSGPILHRIEVAQLRAYLPDPQPIDG
jgi:ATP-dependent helicase/nuclease subunit A